MYLTANHVNCVRVMLYTSELNSIQRQTKHKTKHTHTQQKFRKAILETDNILATSNHYRVSASTRGTPLLSNDLHEKYSTPQ